MLDDGAVVTVHYHATGDDGRVLDSSRGKHPRTFVIGRGQLIPGFNAALRGMSTGERLTVRVPTDDAYGPHRSDLVYEVPVGEAPAGLQPGDEVQLAGGTPARVVNVSAESIQLDANHPLAGLTLNFEIELLAVSDSPLVTPPSTIRSK